MMLMEAPEKKNLEYPSEEREQTPIQLPDMQLLIGCAPCLGNLSTAK
jgi:hypothetical protein